MKRIWLLVIFAICVLLALQTACSQKPSSPIDEKRTEPVASSVPPPSQPAVAQDDRPVIVTFGDSLTQGVAGKSYPAYLQDLLDEHGYHYRVDNQGVSGDTTTDGLARIDNVIAARPALVILEFGGNDGLRGIPVESTRSNLDAMITQLKKAQVPLVLAGITLPPNYGPEYVKPFTAIFPELAALHKVKLLPFLLVNVYQHPEMMQPDGIHPNGTGNKVVAQDVYTLIQPLLKK